MENVLDLNTSDVHFVVFILMLILNKTAVYLFKIFIVDLWIEMEDFFFNAFLF